MAHGWEFMYVGLSGILEPAIRKPAKSRALAGFAMMRGLNSRKQLTPVCRLQIISGFPEGYPSGQQGTDCKSVGSAFEGSNPSPSTKNVANVVVVVPVCAGV